MKEDLKLEYRFARSTKSGEWEVGVSVLGRSMKWQTTGVKRRDAAKRREEDVRAILLLAFASELRAEADVLLEREYALREISRRMRNA